MRSTDSCTIKNAFVYLIGFPGCGKLTIAKELSKLIPSIVVDNHFINNTIFGLIDPDGSTPLPRDVWQKIYGVRNLVLETIELHSKPDRNFIFTDALIEGEKQHQKAFDRLVTCSVSKRANLFVFRIIASEEELVKRIASPERREMLKEIDTNSARKRFREKQIHIPKSVNFVDVDVTEYSPNEAGRKILSLIEEKNEN